MILVDVAYWIKRSLSETIKTKMNSLSLISRILAFTFYIYMPDDLYINNSIISNMIYHINI